jgi:hypothetical protein
MLNTIATLVASHGDMKKLGSLDASNTGNTTIQTVVGEGVRNSVCVGCRWTETIPE